MREDTRELLQVAERGRLDEVSWAPEAMFEAIKNKWLDFAGGPDFEIVLTPNGKEALSNAVKR